MFDKTIALTSTDGSVSLSITGGTEGVKSILVSAAPGRSPKFVTKEQLIDIIAPALKEWFNAPQPASSGDSGPVSS